MSPVSRRALATLPLSPHMAAMALHPASRRDHLAAVDVSAIAAGLAATAADIPLDRREPTREYRCVLSSAAYDAWVIRWAPTADLGLHDHGGARGVVRVVEGELLERYADRANPDRPRSRTVPAGSTITVSASTVHGVANIGPGFALSVHVYSPPLSSMTFYEERGGSLTPVGTSDVATPTRLVPT